jgi:2-polyprenyl-6-methoxyphenol hydroxylase-like FAD-dependent oxidoreductase
MLCTTPIEETEMRQRAEHAVVVGASVAGLLAARVLADHYDRVTVIDRDRLPDGVRDRRAVPQGRHAHSLLPHGQDCLEELLPGSGDELAAAGAVRCRRLDDMRLVVGGHELHRISTDGYSLYASRAFFEAHIRERVLALPNVAVRDGCDVLALTATPDGTRVTGVQVVSREYGAAAEAVEADLVVAATGRGARVPAWLEEIGGPRPVEERVDVDVVYASRHVRLPEDGLRGDRMLLCSASAERPTALFVFPQEGGRYIVSTGGFGAEHHPPADQDALLEYAAAAAPEDLRDVVREAEPTDDRVTQRFPADVRRRYDLLDRIPEGLVLSGDAVCSFNPTYGQGMTVAAAEAVELRDCLADGPEDLGRRHLAAAAPLVDHAWRMSTTADLDIPGVRGTRTDETREFGAYLRLVQAKAEVDPAVAGTLAGTMGMVVPLAALTAPAMRERVVGVPA